MNVKDLIRQLRKLPADMPVMYHSWSNGGKPSNYDDGSIIFYVDTVNNALVTIPDDDSAGDELIPLAEYVDGL